MNMEKTMFLVKFCVLAVNQNSGGNLNSNRPPFRNKANIYFIFENHLKRYRKFAILIVRSICDCSGFCCCVFAFVRSIDQIDLDD